MNIRDFWAIIQQDEEREKVVFIYEGHLFPIFLSHNRYKLATRKNIVDAVSQLTIYFFNDGR